MSYRKRKQKIIIQINPFINHANKVFKIYGCVLTKQNKYVQPFEILNDAYYQKYEL